MVLLCFTPESIGLAQTDVRDLEMFGEDAGAVEDEGADLLQRDVVPDEKTRDDAIFGGSYKGSSVSGRHRDLLDLDRLQLGGMLYLRFMAGLYEGEMDDPTFSGPNLLDIYMDGRPNDRVRGFVRGRLKYDPLTTGTIAGGPRVEGLDIPGARDDPQTIDIMLDQLWLKFDIGRAVYVTVGKQPVHWGTTRLWNPVDVVNSTRRTPLALFDDRAGLYGLKLHVPIEKLAWNVVGLLLLDEADFFEKMGGALRVETVFSSVELSLTGMVKQETGVDGEDYVLPKLALDFSAGIWDLDVTGEMALTFVDESRQEPLFKAGDRDVPLQAAFGLSYTGKYTAEDCFMFGAEYFYNTEGYDDSGDYAAAMIRGEFTPFYMGRHYLAVYLSLPTPGNWDHTSLSLFAVSNLTDESLMVRFDYSTVVLTYLSIQAYAALNSGKRGGEFRYGIREGELFPESPAVPYQALMLGVNLRIDL